MLFGFGCAGLSWCNEGYQGVACASCDNEAGYGSFGSECATCNSQSTTISVVVFILFVVIAGIVYRYRIFRRNAIKAKKAAEAEKAGKRAEAKGNKSRTFPIFLAYLQVTFFLGEFKLKWPESMASLFEVAGTSTVASLSFFDCLYGPARGV